KEIKLSKSKRKIYFKIFMLGINWIILVKLIYLSQNNSEKIN
ncbi:MAG: hypothetical protein RLZZ44_1790, partial [Bacteroidota bacterium]